MRPYRRFRANLIYLRRPFLQFLPLLLTLVAVLAAGSVCFHHFYPYRELTYGEALFVTYSLVYMENPEPYSSHPALQVFYFLLPLLGLVVILDGLVRFGGRILRRQENDADWIKAMTKTYSGHVVLCGLGKVGLRVLEQLLRLGEEVVVLEKNAQNPNLAFARKNHVPVHIGNGREEGIFEDLNVAAAKSIILCTDDDLSNLEMALDARKLQPGIRVVMRMFDQELASKIGDSFDLHLAFSTSAQAAPLFATASSDRSIVNSFYVGERLLVVAELNVNAGSELVGKKIVDIGAKHQVFVLAHTRGDSEAYYPPGETQFAAGDKLVVQTQPETLKLLHRWNNDPQPY